MSRADPQGRVAVCSVTENCLVGGYLAKLLDTDRRVHHLNWERFTRLSPTRRRDTVFIIDRGGLDIPLSECMKRLRGACANAKFIVLDHDESNEEILRLLVKGAQGYIAHASLSKTLLRAILCVAAGQIWAPPEVLKEFLSEVGRILRKDVDKRQPTTPREDEILELVRRRFSNQEIADLLKIQVSTVKFHISNIFSKLHASSRRELVNVPFRKLGKILTD